MNWSLRIPIVISALWLLLSLTFTNISQQFEWVAFILFGIAPLMLGWGLIWIISGYRSQKKNFI